MIRMIYIKLPRHLFNLYIIQYLFNNKKTTLIQYNYIKQLKQIIIIFHWTELEISIYLYIYISKYDYI